MLIKITHPTIALVVIINQCICITYLGSVDNHHGAGYICNEHPFLFLFFSLGSLVYGNQIVIPTAGLSSLGVPGVPWHPQILADQLLTRNMVI